jgi:kinetochore protein NDC80
MSRRQSIGPSISKFPNDPRPITDKTFQLKTMKLLMTFLKEFNYPHAVTHRSLGQPSSKEFNQILTFMLRLTDPNFQVDSNMKFEDEVCLQFKCLGYPFTISKTSLAAAGSPHTWPTLLAALAWLAEHLMRMRLDKSDDYLWNVQPFESLDELQLYTVKAFYQYLLLSYQAFMYGDLARINELELALQKRFDDDDKLLEAEVERVEDLNATIVERTNLMRQDAGK